MLDMLFYLNEIKGSEGLLFNGRPEIIFIKVNLPAIMTGHLHCVWRFPAFKTALIILYI
ncbi:hypothetical protein [Sulfuracidifex metallicus]|uniref:hypothetical protein n=1 Tax=Sulfuracidifex metallicus TaxID=47303 RepID=UPI0012DE6426|nr:hypothetical protein [Sulfuracidifex metallicus]